MIIMTLKVNYDSLNDYDKDDCDCQIGDYDSFKNDGDCQKDD